MWGRGVASIIETGERGESPAQRDQDHQNADIGGRDSFLRLLCVSNRLKIRAFPHTNFVFLSFLLIGLPQNINPALSFERCRSMSSCHFSIASF